MQTLPVQPTSAAVRQRWELSGPARVGPSTKSSDLAASRPIAPCLVRLRLLGARFERRPPLPSATPESGEERRGERIAAPLIACLPCVLGPLPHLRQPASLLPGSVAQTLARHGGTPPFRGLVPGNGPAAASPPYRKTVPWLGKSSLRKDRQEESESLGGKAQPGNPPRLVPRAHATRDRCF